MIHFAKHTKKGPSCDTLVSPPLSLPAARVQAARHRARGAVPFSPGRTDEGKPEDGTALSIPSACTTSTPASSFPAGDQPPRARLLQAFLPYRECVRVE